MSMFNTFSFGIGTPVYNSSSGGRSWGADDWMHIINQGFNTASQAIAAWGKNPSQQTVNATATGVGQGYSPAAVAQAQAQLQQSQMLQQQQLLAAQGAGGVGTSVGSGVDGIVNWAMQNPLPVFLGIAGLFLLMRQPPGRR